MTRLEAVDARRHETRVEWWEEKRSGWRRGKIVSVSREGTVARVIETGKTRSTTKRLEHLRLADTNYERSAP